MSPAIIYLYLSVAAISLLLISILLEVERLPTRTEMKWIASFLLASLKSAFYSSLKKWFKPTKRVKTMNLTSIPPSQWANLPLIQKYQHFLRRKFQEMENMYYPFIKELLHKLEDLGEIHPDSIPDFNIHNFTFLTEWQHGEVSTEYVLSLLKSLNLQNCAEKTICRRLRNFMHGKQKLLSYTYIKAVHDNLEAKCVPLHLKYLEMLVKYFEKMHEIDKAQIKLTWIEQIFTGTGENKIRAREITLNQMYREINSGIIPHNEYKYTIGDNIMVLDEYLTANDMACHWIFGPKQYIDLLKTRFKVSETMDISHEKDYVKRLVGKYVNDSVVRN